MSCTVSWDRLVPEVVPFLVTRQIFAGAGKLGIEGEGSVGQPGIFQISQRADFFSVLVSIDTMNRRPIVNTRDEPHADPGKYRRLPLTFGGSKTRGFWTRPKNRTTSAVPEFMPRRRRHPNRGARSVPTGQLSR